MTGSITRIVPQKAGWGAERWQCPIAAVKPAALRFLYLAVQPAAGKPYGIVPAGLNPARFRSTAEAQTGADALADAAKSILVNFAFPCQTQSDPNPANAAHSKLFSAAGRIPFPTRGVSEATIPAFRPQTAPGRQRRSQTAASLADNLPETSATAKI